tara:strand:+ start:21 stop:257 length:237 start_codon:yes stop_codon:yes gene_type:complete
MFVRKKLESIVSSTLEFGFLVALDNCSSFNAEGWFGGVNCPSWYSLSGLPNGFADTKSQSHSNPIIVIQFDRNENAMW